MQDLKECTGGSSELSKCYQIAYMLANFHARMSYGGWMRLCCSFCDFVTQQGAKLVSCRDVTALHSSCIVEALGLILGTVVQSI